MLNELEHYKLTNTLCGRSKVANDNSSECSYDTHQLPGKDCEGTSGISSHSPAALPEHEHIVRHAVRHCSCGSCQCSTRQQRRQAAPHRPTNTHDRAWTSARPRRSLISSVVSSVVPSLVSSVVSSVKVFHCWAGPLPLLPARESLVLRWPHGMQSSSCSTRCRLCEDKRAESNALGPVQTRAITAAALAAHHCTAAWRLSCSALPATVFRLQLSPLPAKLPACRLLLPARQSVSVAACCQITVAAVMGASCAWPSGGSCVGTSRGGLASPSGLRAPRALLPPCPQRTACIHNRRSHCPLLCKPPCSSSP